VVAVDLSIRSNCYKPFESYLAEEMTVEVLPPKTKPVPMPRPMGKSLLEPPAIQQSPPMSILQTVSGAMDVNHAATLPGSVSPAQPLTSPSVAVPKRTAVVAPVRAAPPVNVPQASDSQGEDRAAPKLPVGNGSAPDLAGLRR